MKQNIYINLIENNKCFFSCIWIELNNPLEFLKWLKKFVKKNFKIKDLWTIYLFYPKILKDKEWKILRIHENINIIYTDNFPYSLKQLSSFNQINKDDIVVSNSQWDYYLYELLNAYTFEYKNLNCELKRIDEKYIEKLFPDVEKKYLSDYIILQIKNEDNSIWHKKTLYYLKKFKGIENLLKNIHKIEQEKYQEIFNYQRERLQYYLLLKNLFISKDDIV